jgi:hydrogenase maturation protease
VSDLLPPGARFIGVGHPFRRDDGVGPWLAEALARRGVEARVHAGDGAGLIEALSDADALVIADAMQSGAPPGTLRVLDGCAGPLPSGTFRNSTHEFGLAAAIETARSLGMLPRSLCILGIEGRDFSFGEGLSPEVEAAAAALLARLCGPQVGPEPATA